VFNQNLRFIERIKNFPVQQLITKLAVRRPCCPQKYSRLHLCLFSKIYLFYFFPLFSSFLFKSDNTSSYATARNRLNIWPFGDKEIGSTEKWAAMWQAFN